MKAQIEDWLPPTVTSLPRTEDSRLTGVRLPLTEDELRRIAERPFLMCEFGDANWFRNVLTMNARRFIGKIDALAAWENEGGK